MIDVVFLLLVFFMLASRFNNDMSLPLDKTVGSGLYQGPPRLIDVAPDAIKLNGVEYSLKTLYEALGKLMASPSDLIFVRPLGKTDVQRLVTVLDHLRDSGFSQLILMQN
jgi:biopolymer transport protein ExbD